MIDRDGLDGYGMTLGSASFGIEPTKEGLGTFEV